MKIYLFFVASVLLGFVAGIRPGVAASFSYAGECFSDPIFAQEKFADSFPVFSGGAVVSLSSSSITDTGILSYTMDALSLTGGSAVSTTSTMQLATCTVGLVASSNQQNMLIVVAAIFACLLGFRLGASMTNRGGVA